MLGKIAILGSSFQWLFLKTKQNMDIANACFKYALLIKQQTPWKSLFLSVSLHVLDHLWIKRGLNTYHILKFSANAMNSCNSDKEKSLKVH